MSLKYNTPYYLAVRYKRFGYVTMDKNTGAVTLTSDGQTVIFIRPLNNDPNTTANVVLGNLQIIPVSTNFLGFLTSYEYVCRGYDKDSNHTRILPSKVLQPWILKGSLSVGGQCQLTQSGHYLISCEDMAVQTATTTRYSHGGYSYNYFYAAPRPQCILDSECSLVQSCSEGNCVNKADGYMMDNCSSNVNCDSSITKYCYATTAQCQAVVESAQLTAEGKCISPCDVRYDNNCFESASSCELARINSFPGYSALGNCNTNVACDPVNTRLCFSTPEECTNVVTNTAAVRSNECVQPCDSRYDTNCFSTLVQCQASLPPIGYLAGKCNELSNCNSNTTRLCYTTSADCFAGENTSHIMDDKCVKPCDKRYDVGCFLDLVTCETVLNEKGKFSNVGKWIWVILAAALLVIVALLCMVMDSRTDK